ncbi:IS200/IS605 family transposase [Stieleria sp. TO1_6]|uniref:IS200/IS605 family transposase n=1 Tax=Stieleria tagensis TaxID=2956795 RepID=UPI00209AEC5A|nr:IS200/IS605 family transposase [Stieleria tagensis]MCO8120550.1 IS200/IS605 family transposase [Stieleria tagensis]
MGQSLVQLYVHLVFATKHRQPLLKNSDCRQRMHSYLAGVCKNQLSPAIIVGGVEDHVHLLCRLGKTIDIAKLIRELKRDSSEWAKRELSIGNFYWQTGYGAFSISPSHLQALTSYITNQEQHHQKESFQDEFRRLCKKYGVEIDERFVWE